MTLYDEQLSAKHLDNIKVEAPSGSTSSTARIGSLERKSTTYDIWSVGHAPNDLVGAEELKELSLMVPRKKKRGKLFLGETHPVVSYKED